MAKTLNDMVWMRKNDVVLREIDWGTGGFRKSIPFYLNCQLGWVVDIMIQMMLF